MMIDLQHVALTYQSPDGEVEALRDISFQMEEGEFVSIVGPSGCGKSTLLSLIAGLERPTAGRILVDGEAVRSPTPKVGFMPQQDQLFPWQTIWANVTLGPAIRHENTPEAQARIRELLARYGLTDFAGKLPGQLSGGMRQRCALIRTLATAPKILLLDESFSALDYQTRLSVSADICRIIRQEPAAGEVLEKGGTISLVVSRGPQMIEMPNVIGFTQEGAVKELEGRGLVPSCFMVVNDGSYAAGCVVRCSADAGSMVEAGSVIVVYIAADPSVANVPATPEAPAASDSTASSDGSGGTSAEAGTPGIEYDTD